jgi:hypothetical protein
MADGGKGMVIREVLGRDLDRRIEEIIKVDQVDEQSVYAEIEEYVITNHLREHYRDLLQAIADSVSEPHERVGIWISGFFGSGKSSFAKYLGYILANRSVLGRPVGDLFKGKFQDDHLAALIDVLHQQVPAETIMFDVSVDRAVRDPSQKLAEVLYTVLLRELGYAEDFELAELEIELEAEGRLDDFVAACNARYENWNRVRKGAQGISRASAVLHALDPATYPAPDSWARSLADRRFELSVGKLVERTFELMARRRPGKALIFVVDEVGQYVSRSVDKIEDLRALVEEFGKEGKNRVRRREAVAPVWLVVTAQERLDEVVAALDSKRVELARLQDRFHYRVDLSPADIREVATRRVLQKRPEAVPTLRTLFAAHQGQLAAGSRLERTHRSTAVEEQAFVDFYPYLPHYIDLSIEIVSGLRVQGGPRHLGGSNRTIIKQAYEMLVSDRTRLADAPLGTLVTLDRIYELVEANLSTERRKDMADVATRVWDSPWPVRVARALALMELVRDLARTPANVAALLLDAVGQAPPRAEVDRALEQLQEAQFVHQAEDGYKLQTVQEKRWEAERRGLLEPRPAERQQLRRELIGELFQDPRVQTYRYKELRSFRLSPVLDGVSLGGDGIALQLVAAEEPDELEALVEDRRRDSRLDAHLGDVFWVFAFSAATERLEAEYHASREMVKKYERIRSEGRITSDEAMCLEDEKSSLGRRRDELKRLLSEALLGGAGVFRGLRRDGSALGTTFAAALAHLLGDVIPELFPKLEMGARPLKGREAEDVLKAATLTGLPAVCYDNNGGLGLVVTEAGRPVPNPAAPVAQEVLGYLQHQHEFGERVSGKDIEAHFAGHGYGWEPDLLRLVLAVLLRAGTIEVVHQGQSLKHHEDPRCRAVFASTQAFRAASFSPRQEQLGNAEQVEAARRYEDLTGEEVDVNVNALATAVRSWASREWELLQPHLAAATAHRLPVAEILGDYRDSLAPLRAGEGASDAEEIVRRFLGEGHSLKAARNRVQRIAGALTEEALVRIEAARRTVETLWPELQHWGGAEQQAARARRITELLADPELSDRLPELQAAASALQEAYARCYEKAHRARAEAFAEALDALRGRPEWLELAAAARDQASAPLLTHSCDAFERGATDTACTTCRASLRTLRDDVALLPRLQADAVAKLQELLRPDVRVERVRVGEVVRGALTTAEDVEDAMGRLREQLLRLIETGVRIVLE